MMQSNSPPNHPKDDLNDQIEEKTSANHQELDPSPSEKEGLNEDGELSPLETPEETALALPEPDAENITVLTNKLPNTPILPWNHYDSPWKALEEESQTSGDSEAEEEGKKKPDEEE